MAGGSLSIWAGSLLGLAAVGLLRLAWSRPRRSAAANAIAWTTLAASAPLAWEGGGAWGVAVASLCAMAAALVLLAVAGARSRPGRAKASDRRVGLLPEAGEGRRIGGRVATFLLVVVGGLVVSIGLAVAVRGLGGLLGWSEANANTLALYVAPLAWAVLAAVLLMQARRRSQLATLLVCGLAALPFLVVGAAP